MSDQEEFDLEQGQAAEETDPVVEGGTEDSAPPVDTDSQSEDSGQQENSLSNDDQEKVNDDQEKVNERIGKITREKHEAIRDKNKALGRVSELESQLDQDQGPPTREGCDFDEAEFQSKMIEYQVNQGLKKQKASQESQQQQQDKEFEEQELYRKYAKRADAFGKTDFSEKTQRLSFLEQANPAVTDAIMALENGPQVAYYLSENLERAEALAGMSPINAALMLGQISSSIPSTSPAPSPTKALPPVSTLKGGGAASVPMEDMDTADYIAQRIASN